MVSSSFRKYPNTCIFGYNCICGSFNRMNCFRVTKTINIYRSRLKNYFDGAEYYITNENQQTNSSSSSNYIISDRSLAGINSSFIFSNLFLFSVTGLVLSRDKSRAPAACHQAKQFPGN